MVLMKGRLIYIGTPGNALKWFEVEHFSSIFELLPRRKAEAWASDFASSNLCREFSGRSAATGVRDVEQKNLNSEPQNEQDSVFDARAKLAELKKARAKKS